MFKGIIKELNVEKNINLFTRSIEYIVGILAFLTITVIIVVIIKDFSAVKSLPFSDYMVNIGLVLVNAAFVILVWRQVSQTNVTIRDIRKQTQTMSEQLDVSEKNLELARQNKIDSDLDVNSRLRPWIGFTSVEVKLHEIPVPGSNRYIAMPAKNDSGKIYFVKSKNYGIYPATKLYCFARFSSEQINSDEPINSDLDIAFPHPPILMPGQDGLGFLGIPDGTIWFRIYAQYISNRTNILHESIFIYFRVKNDGEFILFDGNVK